MVLITFDCLPRSCIFSAIKGVILCYLTIPFLETDNQCQFFILQQNDEWSSCHIYVDSQYLNALQYQGHRYHWCRGVQLQAVSHFGQRLLGHCTFGPEIFGTKIFGSETFGPKIFGPEKFSCISGKIVRQGKYLKNIFWPKRSWPKCR